MTTDEVTEFFNGIGLQESKLKIRRPQGVDQNRIRPAMAEVHRRILCGEKIDPLMIARKVWEVARRVEPENTTVDCTIQRYKETANENKLAIRKLTEENSRMVREKELTKKRIIALVASEILLLWLYIGETTGMFRLSDFIVYLMEAIR